MAEEVGALRVSVRANAAEIEADLGKVKSIVNNFSSQATRSLTGFAKGANAAVAEIFNLRNAAIGLAGGAFVALVKKSIDYGDSIGEIADMAGVTGEKLQELRYAMGLAGVKTEEADKALMQLSKRLGEAQSEVNETSKALGKLGISMADVKGKSTDEVIKMVADRIKLIPDPMTRAAIATDLFGKAGQKLLPTLVQGSEYLVKMADEAHKMGLVLSQDTLKKASDANDEFDRIGTALKVAGVNISVGFLPALTKLREVFTSQDFQDGVQNVARHMGDLVKWMVDNKETIVTVTTAFAGMKLGAAFGGAMAGKRGAVAGGIIGAVAGIAAGSVMATKEVDKMEGEISLLEQQLSRIGRDMLKTSDPTQIGKLATEADGLNTKLTEARKKLAELKAPKAAEEAAPEPLKVTVSKAPLEHFPQVDKAIEDLAFKTRVLQGDFDGLAKGFPELAQGLGVFGAKGYEAVTAVEKLHPQLQALNDAMLANQAARVIDSIKTSTERYSEELARLQQLHAAGKLSAEQYAVAVSKIQFPSLTRAIDDATNATKQFDELATNSLNSTADAFADFASGASTAQEAAKKLAQSVVADLTRMIAKALIFRTVGSFMGFAGGGPIDLGSAESFVKAASGGRISGPGTGTSDSVPARLSNGEYVVNADATRKNLDLLNAMNFGDWRGFADGGLVAPAPGGRLTKSNDAGGGRAVNVHLGDTLISGDMSPSDRAWIMALMDQRDRRIQTAIVPTVRQALSVDHDALGV